MKISFSHAVAQLQDLANSFIALLPNIGLGLIVLVLFLFLASGVRAVVANVFSRYKRNRNLGLVMGRLARWTVMLVGVLIAAVIVFPNFTPGQLVQLLGIGSVAIGFAFKDIFQNFLAGILILITEPFRIGDQIVLKDYEGTVEQIETRATFIRTYDGRRIVIPNAELFTNAVVVNTAFDNRRLQYDIGIGYGDDIKTARKLILDTVQSTEGVLKDPAPDVLVMDLAESTVNLRARWWVNPPNRASILDKQDLVLTRIKNALTEAGIDLPFPTQQILFHDQTEATDGDRSRQREGWPAGRKEAPEQAGLAVSVKELLHAQQQPEDK